MAQELVKCPCCKKKRVMLAIHNTCKSCHSGDVFYCIMCFGEIGEYRERQICDHCLGINHNELKSKALEKTLEEGKICKICYCIPEFCECKKPSYIPAKIALYKDWRYL